MEERLVIYIQYDPFSLFSETNGNKITYIKLINNFQVTTSYMKMVSSYVMQDDQLFPMLTVFETFMFAAEIRLPPSISRDEKRSRVYALLEQLGLQVIQIPFLNAYAWNSLHKLDQTYMNLYNRNRAHIYICIMILMMCICRVQHILTSVMRGGEECREEKDEGCQLALTSSTNLHCCFLMNRLLVLTPQALTVSWKRSRR